MFMYDRVSLKWTDLNEHPLLGEYIDKYNNKIFYVEKDKEITLQYYSKDVEFWENKNDRSES